MNVELYIYQKKPDTLVEQMRDHLETLESRVFFLPQRDRPFILDYLAEMDAAWQLCELLSTSGASEAGEALRFHTLQKQVQARAAAILKILGGPAALKWVRPPDASPTRQPWWFVDRVVAQRRAERWKLVTKIAAAIAVVVLVIVVLFNTLLKPDPAVVLRIQYYNDALTLAAEHRDHISALTEIEQALTVAPDNVELLVFKGVLLAQLNRTAEAEMLFEQATDLAGKREQVLFLRGQLLWQLNHLEAALALAQEAIAINPEYAEAWFLAGQVYMGLGQTPEAYETLSTVADLARAQDNDPLYVMAKINLAHLSQGAGLEP